MPEFLTYARALDLLREVIAEKGTDFVYEPPAQAAQDCLYVHGSVPGCGVGHVFYRAGWTLDELSSIDHQEEAGVSAVLAFRLWADPEALRLLDAFQIAQDLRLPWGESLRDALRAVGGESDE